MNKNKINELLNAAHESGYSKVEDLKELISEDDYEKSINIFNEYSQKSEQEILKELKRLKKIVPNQEEIIQQIMPFLDDEQKLKLDRVLEALKDS